MMGNMTELELVEKSLGAKMNKQLHLHEEKEWRRKIFLWQSIALKQFPGQMKKWEKNTARHSKRDE